MADLFVQTPQFGNKGFEVIHYMIESHFNPYGTVDVLGHSVDICDTKQHSYESVVSLKARFSHLFVSLHTGGMHIHSALQVGLCFGHCFRSTPVVSSMSFVLVGTP